MLQSFQPPWWKRAVIYQVYPRSFTDSDGDLPGLVARLDHLHRLGGDALWPSPVYRSPDPALPPQIATTRRSVMSDSVRAGHAAQEVGAELVGVAGRDVG